MHPPRRRRESRVTPSWHFATQRARPKDRERDAERRPSCPITGGETQSDRPSRDDFQERRYTSRGNRGLNGPRLSNRRDIRSLAGHRRPLADPRRRTGPRQRHRTLPAPPTAPPPARLHQGSKVDLPRRSLSPRSQAPAWECHVHEALPRNQRGGAPNQCVPRREPGNKEHSVRWVFNPSRHAPPRQHRRARMSIVQGKRKRKRIHTIAIACHGTHQSHEILHSTLFSRTPAISKLWF